ncbi:MAG: hypothetical protein AAFX87_04530, partial [Bacteroidota bacterium]
MIRLLYFFIFYFIISFNVEAQQSSRKLELFPTIGYTWRSTATEFLNLNGVSQSQFNILYDYERNVQGFSLNTGILLRYNKKLEFEYYPGWRYDVIQAIPGTLNERKKGFIVDHNVNLLLKKKLGIGIGFSVVNAGKGYYNDRNLNRNGEYQSIQFDS